MLEEFTWSFCQHSNLSLSCASVDQAHLAELVLGVTLSLVVRFLLFVALKIVLFVALKIVSVKNLGKLSQLEIL